MKRAAQVLIAVAAVVTVITVISRLAQIPVGGIRPVAMVGFAGLLLLFAIALEGLK